MEYTIGTKVFGDWEIVREIGEGSYGKVFELHKSNFGVKANAALKLIRIPKSVSEIKEALSEGMDERTVTTYFEGIVQQFVKEIAIMTELKSHANIVSCEDYVVKEHEGTIGWDILIRMELLTPMQDYLTKNAMTEETVRKLAIDMCEALVFIQKKGLIHRDIKPGNIFIDSMGRFKLGDFGVARTAEKTMGGMSKQGTENYMAPEVYYVRPYGASVDIYSLGIVLYRLMNNNRLPFYPPAPAPIRLSDREGALKKRMEGEQLPPPCNGSEAFVSIILKACEADPRKRYRTAGEMLAALTTLTGEKTAETPAGSDVPELQEGEDMEPPVEEFDSDDDGTVNPFGDLKGFGKESIGADAVEDEDTEDDEDETINPFGNIPERGGRRKDPIEAEPINLDITKILKFTLDKDPRGKTIDVAADGKKVRVSVPASLESGQTMRLNGLGKTNLATGEKGNLLLTIEIDDTIKSSRGKKERDSRGKEITEEPKETLREAITRYCREHLTDMWANSTDLTAAVSSLTDIFGASFGSSKASALGKHMTKWKAYTAPEIPLQIYSNAIFNIGENEVKKNEIIGILDCTPDTRIPCGGGIIVTEDRMIIQLGEAAVSTNTRPKAVIYFNQFKDAEEVEVKKFMVKTKAFRWTDKNGKQYTYESSMSHYVSYTRITRVLRDLAAIYKEHTK